MVLIIAIGSLPDLFRWNVWIFSRFLLNRFDSIEKSIFQFFAVCYGHSSSFKLAVETVPRKKIDIVIG